MYAAELIYIITIVLAKTSILLLYIRMFSPSLTLRILLHITLGANITFYSIGFFLEIFMCIPREAIWNPWIEDYKCINMAAMELAAATFNAVSDFTILILPMSTVWNLNARREKRIALMAVFATGLLYVLEYPPFSLL